MKKRRDDDTAEEMTPEEQARSEDYLSRLADSVLKKEPFPYKQRVQGPDRTPLPHSAPPGAQSPSDQRQTPPPSSRDAVPKPPSATPRPTSPTPRPASHSPRPVAATPRPIGHTPRPIAGTPRPVGATPRPASRPQSQSTPSPEGSFAVGTILLFEEGILGVYKDPRADKDYEVVAILESDGTITPQGLALENYDIKVLGVLPPEFMHRLNRRRTWVRDEICYHLNTYDHCARIPHPVASDETRRREAEPEDDGRTPLPVRRNKEAGLVHGRHFTIAFGPKEWSGIYWGEDELGSVVAHQTHEKWSLMHLDLDRFRDSLKLGEVASADEISRIADEINNA